MPAERGNMTDHADIVREFLDGNNVEGVRSARAALDALVVERDEARAAYQREVEAFRALGGSNLMQAIARAEAAEAERDTANADWHRMRDLHADALTEVKRLKEAMDLAMHDHGNAYEILGAALAGDDA